MIVTSVRARWCGRGPVEFLISYVGGEERLKMPNQHIEGTMDSGFCSSETVGKAPKDSDKKQVTLKSVW
jgi:hypothetical protein